MNKLISFKIDWLFWFLIIAPTFYIAGTDTRMAQLEFFKIAIIALIALFHSNKWIGAFLGYAMFQLVFIHSDITKVIPNIFFGAVLYHFITKCVRPSPKYLWALYGVLILNIVWAVLQIYQIDPIFMMVDQQHQTIMTEFPGFFALPAFLGNYAAVVLPLSFTLSPVLFPFALIGLFFSKSSFSVLAALVASLFYFWFRKRIVFWVILLVFGCISAFYVINHDLPSGQFSRRLSAWKLITSQAFKSQFLGHGIGSYGTKYFVVETAPSLKNRLVSNNKQLLDFIAEEAKDKKEWGVLNAISQINPDDFDDSYVMGLKNLLQDHQMDYHIWDPAHNEFLQVFFDMGLVGILIIGGYIFDLFRRFLQYGNDPIIYSLMAAFVAILIVSFGHFPFHIARLASPFIVILALLDTCLLRVEHDIY